MPKGENKKSNYPVYWEHGKYEDILITGKHKNKLPPLEILKWMFRYDNETGKLYKIRESSGKLYEPEREITNVNGSVYLAVSITDSEGLMKKFQVHQLIYYIYTGVEPLSIVDHIDGNPLNNKFDNLRLTTESGNQRNAKMKSNNTSGTTGVYWNKQKSKWQAYSSDNTGKQRHLGYFDNIETAASVVQSHYSNPNNGYSERHGVVA